MSILILQISYDGAAYSGWQLQPNATTIQGVICDVLSKLFGYIPNLVGAGRTDSKVNANALFAHCILEKPLSIQTNKLRKAINFYLPNDIYINNIAITENNFHSRFDAIAREYIYFVRTDYSVFRAKYSYYSKMKIDFEVLNQVAEIFLGTHDFTTFSKYNPDITNPVCIVEKSIWSKVEENEYKYTIRANHFLYGMVRSLVGVMLDVARGKRCIDEIKQALQMKDRKLNSPLAPPNALFLNNVFYPTNIKFDWVEDN